MGTPLSKMNSDVQNTLATPNDQRLREGARLLEMMWYNIAEEVVAKAIVVYHLTEEQATALRRAFLRPNDYYVVVG